MRTRPSSPPYEECVRTFSYWTVGQTAPSDPLSFASLILTSVSVNADLAPPPAPVRTAPPSAPSPRGFAPWPVFDDEMQAAVAAVLASGKVNQWTGGEVTAFEAEYAEATGVRHAVALMNGSVAIELALIALGVGPGDEVVVTPRSFMASVSSVVLVGATPVFADVDPESGNLTAETIAAVLTERTRAVVPVHLAGWPCEMDPIMALAREHSFFVIEDCAQAHGALLDGRPVGSVGHVGCFSFCQDKIITTAGEGGLLTTDDTDLFKRAWAFKDHGKGYDTVFNQAHPPGFRWLHDGFGTNWRMTEVQATVGRVALRRLPEWTRQRRANAAALREHLVCHDAFGVPEPRPGAVHAEYKTYWTVRPERLAEGWSRDRIVEAAGALGVPLFSGSCSEIYRERAFDGTGWRPEGGLPAARALGETSLMTLVHPTLSEADLHDVGRAVDAVMAEASAAR